MTRTDSLQAAHPHLALRRLLPTLPVRRVLLPRRLCTPPDFDRPVGQPREQQWTAVPGSDHLEREDCAVGVGRRAARV